MPVSNFLLMQTIITRRSFRAFRINVGFWGWMGTSYSLVQTLLCSMFRLVRMHSVTDRLSQYDIN